MPTGLDAFVAYSPIVVSLVILGYVVAVSIAVITDDRDPTATLAWLLVLYAVPVLGLVFYLLFGRNWKKRMASDPWLAEVRALADAASGRVREQYAETHDEALAWAEPRGYADIVRIIERTGQTPALPAYGVEVLIDGAAKFEALKADLAQAQDTINMQYFIWERDELTAELTRILLDRLAAGVEVRMLNDLVGNIFYKKDEIKRLKAAGAHIEFDVVDLRQINYRNHRKIVVIDGVTGYTGGINVGQEYIDGGARYPSWRDTHVRFSGPLVADLQRLFAIRWHARTRESLFAERFFPLEYPRQGRRSVAQLVSTGVDIPWDPARRAHITGIAEARERVWIQSPYLVPTPDIYTTMLDAALSGLDVRFMMTGLPDKKIAFYAAESFFRQMIEAGIKIYRYNTGFMHAKTMTLDGEVLVVGTMNLDIRSLQLHKELMVWFYDPELAAEHERVFERDMRECELMTIEMIDEWSWSRRLRNSSARLAANLL